MSQGFFNPYERFKTAGGADLEPVLKENLYANAVIPQMGLGIFASTLYSLFSSQDPNALTKTYLTTDPSLEQIESMVEKANRAHTAFGVKIKSIFGPARIDTQSIIDLWAEEKLVIRIFLSKLLDISQDSAFKFDINASARAIFISTLEEHPLPVDILLPPLRAVVEAIHAKENRELFQDYRATLRGTPSDRKLAEDKRISLTQDILQVVFGAIGLTEPTDRSAIPTFNTLLHFLRLNT